MASNITIEQQAEIARILGYPNISPMNSLQLEYPTFASQYALWQPYATLLNRLAQCSPYDEVQYLGGESPIFSTYFAPAFASLTFSTGGSIATGTLVQLNLGGTTEEYTTVAGDTPNSVCLAVAKIVQDDPQVNTQFLANAAGAVLSLYNIAVVGTDGNGVPIIAASGDSSLLLSFGSSPAQVATGQTSGGKVPPGPQYTPKGTSDTVFGYVPIIHTLESDLVNVRRNLDTLKADVWTVRPDEAGARFELLRFYRKELANRLGVPLDPDLIGNDNTIAQRIV